MTRSTIFKTNRTQAVRIPKQLAFPDSVKEVEVTREGDKLTVLPKYRSWKEWFEHGPRVSEDFMLTRDEPPDQERDPL